MSLLLLTRAWVPLGDLVHLVDPVLLSWGASVAFVDCDPSISFPRLCFDRMDRMSLLLLTRAWVSLGHVVNLVDPVLSPVLCLLSRILVPRWHAVYPENVAQPV